jgi:hypothetical protein
MLRFAVHRLGNPIASPRSYRMPCGNVSSCVHVGVTGEGASSAPEDGLALARFPVHMPAGTAALTSECRVEHLNPAGGFLIQPTDEQPPPGGEDFPIQSGLLAHAAPRVASGPPGASGHVHDGQAFDADQIEAARQVGADPLTPILAGISLPGFEAGDSESGLGAPFTAALRASQPALQQAQTPLARPAQPGTTQQFTIRQGRAHSHATVNADDLPDARAIDGLRDRSEGNVPPTSTVQGDPERLRAIRNGAGPAKPNPVAFWDKYFPRSPVQPAHMLRLNRDNTEPFVASGLAPCRPTVSTREQVLHGLVKIAQRLLLHHLAAGGQPRMFPPRGGELSALLQVTRSIRPPWAPPRLLFAGKIPHEPGVGAMLPQNCLVGSRRAQAVAGHTKTLSSAADIPEEVKRRLVHCSKRQVTTPRTV